jgi:hypothetical protein
MPADPEALCDPNGGHTPPFDTNFVLCGLSGFCSNISRITYSVSIILDGRGKCSEHHDFDIQTNVIILT